MLRRFKRQKRKSLDTYGNVDYTGYVGYPGDSTTQYEFTEHPDPLQETSTPGDPDLPDDDYADEPDGPGPDANLGRKRRAVIWQSEKDGKFYYHIKAANHRVTDRGQGYKQKSSVTAKLKKDYPGLPVVDKTKD